MPISSSTCILSIDRSPSRQDSRVTASNSAASSVRSWRSSLSRGQRLTTSFPLPWLGRVLARDSMSEPPFLFARSLGRPARLLLAVCAFLLFFGGLGSIPLLD